MNNLSDDDINEVIGDGTCTHLPQVRMALEIREYRAAVKSFVETVNAAVRANESRGRGGQHVPFHGDFCAATPSVLTRLQWWARNLVATLPKAGT